MSFNPLGVAAAIVWSSFLFFSVLLIGDAQCRHNKLYFVFLAV